MEPQMAPSWSQNGEKARKKSQRNKKAGGVPRRRPILTESGANMAPNLGFKMEPRCPKNRFQNRLFFWCLLGSILVRCWWIFGSKTKPSWHYTGIKNRCEFGKAIFQKSCSGYSGGSIFHNLLVQVGRKHRLKLDPKTESKMECFLTSICERF